LNLPKFWGLIGYTAVGPDRPGTKLKENPMIIKINPDNPQERLLRRAAETLTAGGLIAYPTDTCYAIGCDLYNLKGINRIYYLKRRPLNKPFSFICRDLKNISEYARVGNSAYKVMKRLLPGPYTFVLEASRQVPKILQTKRRTVGIRVPDHPIALGLVELLGHPIITTTVALPDSPVESDPYEIEIKFKPHLELVIDGGLVLPEPSSIISFIDDVPEVLRVGKGDVSAFA
jgi:tRNA threonylcarbamoyl adenosine modification protein (Sua5/YciO/YrdC/YwlC family)